MGKIEIRAQSIDGGGLGQDFVSEAEARAFWHTLKTTGRWPSDPADHVDRAALWLGGTAVDVWQR